MFTCVHQDYQYSYPGELSEEEEDEGKIDKKADTADQEAAEVKEALEDETKIEHTTTVKTENAGVEEENNDQQSVSKNSEAFNEQTIVVDGEKNAQETDKLFPKKMASNIETIQSKLSVLDNHISSRFY